MARLYNKKILKEKTFMIIRETIVEDGKKFVTLNVPQGIGDIFWVYQKFSPYFDIIHFNILVTGLDAVQKRASEWLKLLPKVGTISLQEVSHARYSHVINHLYSMQSILDLYKKGLTDFDYSCNLALEKGIRIDDIDKEYSVEVNVPMHTEHAPLAYDDYMAVYISGGTKELGAIKEGAWSVNLWCEFLFRFYLHHKKAPPIIFIGANYDSDVIHQVSRFLAKKNRVPHHIYIDSYPANVCHILKNAKYFIGYQSGLNILADNFDTPQFMLYFSKLAPMQYSWCKKENIKTKFNSALFNNSPKKVLDMIKPLELFS